MRYRKNVQVNKNDLSKAKNSEHNFDKLRIGDEGLVILIVEY